MTERSSSGEAVCDFGAAAAAATNGDSVNAGVGCDGSTTMVGSASLNLAQTSALLSREPRNGGWSWCLWP